MTMRYARCKEVKKERQGSNSRLRPHLPAGHIPLLSSSRRIQRHTPKGKMAAYPAPAIQGWTRSTRTRGYPVLTTLLTRQVSCWSRFTQRSAEPFKRQCISFGLRAFQDRFRYRSAHRVGTLHRPARQIQGIQQIKLGLNLFGMHLVRMAIPSIMFRHRRTSHRTDIQPGRGLRRQ